MPSARPRILCIFGTRPEAIKMAPVVMALRGDPQFDAKVAVTGQHREMLDSALRLFGIVPDWDLAVLRPRPSLEGLTAAILEGVAGILREWRPDRILVHGDTTTTLAASLAAYYAKVPIGHVEAGLRTPNLYSPWPEEMNRRVVDSLSDLQFAPTELSRKRLLTEGSAPERVFMTGNTVIDALMEIRRRFAGDPGLAQSIDKDLPALDPARKIVLVTGHRRENFGESFRGICRALLALSKREDVQVVYPVHLNPEVRKPVNDILGGQRTVSLIEPLDYLAFVRMMDRATLIITDSGVQEEAPALGKPVLVMREVTERPEAVESGTAILVGTDEARIVAEASRLLDDPARYRAMATAHNPYGDGRAAERIVQALKAVHG